MAELAQEIGFMQRALALSQQALPACRPNPPVGCVLVKEGKIVSEGFTQPPGYIMQKQWHWQIMIYHLTS